MTRHNLTFLLAGLAAGLVTVAGATVWPMLLVYGVGPTFFVAVLAAIILTGSSSYLSRGWWRIIAGICICTLAYLLAFFTFWVVAGYLPDLLGIRAADDRVGFGADVWVGLLPAALVASACVELLVYVLTSEWSNSFLSRFAAAGLVSVLVTFVADLAGHSYWTFYGILLPVGESLFCWIVGAQIWMSSRQAMQHA